jgi:hypothetical protein
MVGDRRGKNVGPGTFPAGTVPFTILLLYNIDEIVVLHHDCSVVLHQPNCCCRTAHPIEFIISRIIDLRYAHCCPLCISLTWSYFLGLGKQRMYIWSAGLKFFMA